MALCIQFESNLQIHEPYINAGAWPGALLRLQQRIGVDHGVRLDLLRPVREAQRGQRLRPLRHSLHL